MRVNLRVVGIGIMIMAVVVARAQTNTFPASGNVGIGTTQPGQALTVSGNIGVVNINAQRQFTYAAVGGVNTDLWFQSSTSFANNGAFAGLYLARQNYQSAGSGNDLNDLVGLHINGFYNNSGAQLPIYLGGFSYSSEVPAVTIDQSGSVGIGTTSPTAPLEVTGKPTLNGPTLIVDGNIELSGSNAHIIFPDGSTQAEPYKGVACGGDYAEQVNVTGDRKHFHPGDVLVVDPDHPGQFLKSDSSYATAVAGVYSTKPGFVGHAVGMPKTANQVPMAMLGIVPTKVSAMNGPIHPGDLLVTSSILGTAMKGTDRSRLTGAVIGKALGSLNSGTGMIEVLVTLQ